MLPESKQSECHSDGSGGFLTQPLSIRSIALTSILVLLCFYTAYFAAPILMPIALAFLLNMVLSPVMRGLTRLHIPNTVAAIVVILAILGLVVTVVYTLSEPAAQWMERAPTVLRDIERKLKPIKAPIGEIKRAQEKLSEITNVEQSSASALAAGRLNLAETLLTSTTDALFGVGVTLILLFFLLSSGDSFLRKLVRVIPQFEDKKRAVEGARDIQHHISRYLATITLINMALGLAVALVLTLLKVPNPFLWGTMVTLFNFVPYMGAITSVGILAVVGFLTFDSYTQMAMPALAVSALSVLEGQLITPAIAGRRLDLSPVAVFIALVVMGWIWGVVGALIAIPLLASFKVVCEEIEPLSPIAEFLGD